MTAARFFALVPAAGHSSRMGEPKLLMPLAGQPLILHTLAAWAASRVDRIIVVIRPGDESLAATVQHAFESKIKSQKSKIELVIPDTPPPDMKASLHAALAHIERNHLPTDQDAFLVAPADIPRLSTPIIDRLIERHRAGATSSIVVPTITGQRGHPALFAWPLAAEVFQLAANEGLNAIVERHQPLRLPCEDLVAAGEYPFADVDTKDDYEQVTNGK